MDKPWVRDSKHYRSAHNWVKYYYGRPKECEHCKLTLDSTRYFAWANVSGKYEKVRDDWRRLCMRCHKAFDSGFGLVKEPRRYCLRGHFLSVDNIYFKKSQGTTECRKCKVLATRKWYMTTDTYKRNHPVA